MGAGGRTQLANRKLTAGLLGICLGCLGLHKFVLGYTSAGVLMLLLSLVGGTLTCGIAAVVMWAIGLVEGIAYLAMPPEQFRTLHLDGRRPWF